MSEVEEYERVSLNAQPNIAVRGPAVNDVAHLLAELIENATSFSAADMLVDISGQSADRRGLPGRYHRSGRRNGPERYGVRELATGEPAGEGYQCP